MTKAELLAQCDALREQVAQLETRLQQSQEVYFQQRLAELLADRGAFRALLMTTAQTALEPRELFDALHALHQLG